MSDWQHYMLMQINTDMREMRADVKSLRARFEELTTWCQRAALLVFLWGLGIAINLDPEKTATFVMALLHAK